VPSQQPNGQLQTQHSPDAGVYIIDKHKLQASTRGRKKVIIIIIIIIRLTGVTPGDNRIKVIIIIIIIIVIMIRGV
jgi:hypothetical protein